MGTVCLGPPAPLSQATWSEGAGLQFFLLFLITCSALTEERCPSPSPLRTESGSLSSAPESRRCQGVLASRTLRPNQQDLARPEPPPPPRVGALDSAPRSQGLGLLICQRKEPDRRLGFLRVWAFETE